MTRNRVTANDLLIGAHQFIAGGTPVAVKRGVLAGCRVLQIFVKNNSQWVGKTIGEAGSPGFRRAARRARDLVLHSGAHGGEGEAVGVARIASSLDDAFRLTEATRVRVLIETAAGQETSIGHRFDHLRDIFGAVRQRQRLAV